MKRKERELAKTIYAAMMLRYGRWSLRALLFGLGIIGLYEACRYLVGVASAHQGWALYLAYLVALVAVIAAMAWKEAKLEASDRLSCKEDNS